MTANVINSTLDAPAPDSQVFPAFLQLTDLDPNPTQRAHKRLVNVYITFTIAFTGCLQI